MIAGHFGLAAVVKAREPQVPLWSLMLATVWLDVVFVPLLLMGVETIAKAEGEVEGYGHAIIHADYTHSALGALLLSALFGLVAGRAWGRRAGWVLGGVSFSHWLLDLLVHRADMPWLPANLGDLPRLGLGLWRVPFASVAVEAALVLLGAWLYARATRRLPHRQGLGRTVALLILAGGPWGRCSSTSRESQARLPGLTGGRNRVWTTQRAPRLRPRPSAPCAGTCWKPGPRYRTSTL